MGSVTIERRRQIWRDFFRSYVVTVDGREVGKLRSGGKETFNLEPGLHEVRMKIDWCGSPTITVDGSADTQMICNSNGTAFTAIFRTSEYISLKRV